MAARPQPGVYTVNSLHGLILFCQLREGHVASARLKLAKLPNLLNSLSERFSESLLSVVTAVGSRGWERLCPAPETLPPGLRPFPKFDQAVHSLTVNQYDLVLLIRSDRVDTNFFAGRVLLDWFGDDLQLVLEHNVFHYLDNRNLLGFKCQRALHGPKLEQSCWVQAPQQPLWHLGSFMFIQHFLLHLESWHELKASKQEQIIGRSKLNNEPLSTHLSSHADKTAMVTSAPLVWQQMPSASMREQGHVDVMWARDFNTLTEFVRQRVEEDENGFCDPLLDYQSNTVSCALFVPPLAWFQALNPG
ncbi:Dyp-type peroxidase [Aliidiomarina maris]|uniref:Putative iron-dependent peroxidase n=1 Tax=Aliidiomarina maris TaxID=531312 RepID=A0A327X5J0_9GAMM|nr:Dyp-type peroxidase [Aliidiomarina maris]RAK00614.1 putative iron-dependent peroxidase [Aliidiomarina maris]RUO27374.1 hypothetical protein CWE07_05380 [Aliidiomarina maris]